MKLPTRKDWLEAWAQHLRLTTVLGIRDCRYLASLLCLPDLDMYERKKAELEAYTLTRYTTLKGGPVRLRHLAEQVKLAAAAKNANTISDWADRVMTGA